MLDQTEMARRIRLAEETILTDERLRGTLTDDAFQRILAWALPQASEIAQDTFGLPDTDAAEAAIYGGLQALKQKIREAGQVVDADRPELQPLGPADQATEPTPAGGATEGQPDLPPKSDDSDSEESSENSSRDDEAISSLSFRRQLLDGFNRWLRQ